MKTRIFNLIIIDESGSMQYIKTAIYSVNETIQTIHSAQKKQHEEQKLIRTSSMKMISNTNL